jgi:hypothetical protein
MGTGGSSAGTNGMSAGAEHGKHKGRHHRD